MFFLSRPSYVFRIFKTRDWPRILVFLAFCAVALGVAGGAYVGFLRGFRFFRQDPYFSTALSAYALEATFLIVLVMMFASASVSGMRVLFGSAENQFLLSTPVGRFRLFASRFLENAFASAWPVALIGIPALAAFSRVYAVSFTSIIVFFIALGIIFFGAMAFASLLDFFLVRMFRMVRGRGTLLLLGALVLGGAYVIGRVLIPLNLKELFSAERFDIVSAPIDLIFSHFKFVPPHAAVQFLFLSPSTAFSAGSFWVVFAQTLLASAVLFALARTHYLKLLSCSFEGVFIARPEDRVRIRAGFKKFPLILRGAVGALLEKDILVFLRSGRETSRAFFLLFMLFLYLFLFRRLRAHGADLAPDVLLRVLFFNLAVIGYFITTLSLRFVFPLISLEGKSAWATFASPLPRTALFWEKLLSGLLPIAAAVLFLAFSSSRVLGLEGLELPVFLRIVLGMSVVLIVLSFVIGVLWPNFHDRDPDKLSTTMPGLFATALSLGYVAIASYVGFLSIRAYLFEGRILPLVILPLAALNLFAVVLLLWLGLRRIKTLDIST